MSRALRLTLPTLLVLPLVSACLSEVEGIAPAQPAETTVEMDFYDRPLPNIPLPNDIATRHDARSATGRRVNASMIAPTQLESRIRTQIDSLDGWGVNQSITIPFSGPLDIDSLLAAHRDADYDLSDDVIYLVDVDRASPEFGKRYPLDFGNGNYPTLLERPFYAADDPRGWTLSLLFEEADEDENGNGRLDPGEDSDGDGVLDRPNYLPGRSPERDDLRGRADALMEFYERETDTLIARPLVPLRERTTYAVVVTRRLLDASGAPVGSPYKSINHVAQNDALRPLVQLAEQGRLGVSLDEIAFAFSYTTQSLQSHWVAVREGLYGHGVQGHIGRDFPADVEELYPLKDLEHRNFEGSTNARVLYSEELRQHFDTILRVAGGSLDPNSYQFKALDQSLDYIDYHVFGRFRSPQLFPRRYSELPGEAPSCEALCAHQRRCEVDRAERAEGPYEARDEAGCLAACRGAEGGQLDGNLDLRSEEDGDTELERAPWSEGQRRCRLDRCQHFAPCEDEDPLLPYDAQSWPGDLDSAVAPTRSEDVYFWLTVPRKEVSVRGEGAPAPVTIVGHGYTLHRLDSMLGFAGHLAKQGNATIAIDCVSHGLYFPPEYVSIAEGLGRSTGLGPLIQPLLAGRAADLNRDGVFDSGADFWTAYLFHTRDMVRQCALDHMQLIRILRAFDGQRTWRPEAAEEGVAGDFDGDGVVDVGGADGIIGMTGTSLGGIMAGILAGLEPSLDLAVPIAGGGILSDIGLRSFQEGVREAVIYRLMSPIYFGSFESALIGEDQEPAVEDADGPLSGTFRLSAVLPQLNQSETLPLGRVEGVEIGDTMVAENLQNGERRCTPVQPEGWARLAVQSDLEDLTVIRFYRGEQRCLCEEEGCGADTPEPYATLDRFEEDIEFQGISFEAGSHLRAIAEGLGLERATPRLRRFFNLSQLVLDAGDPATFGRHWLQEPLVYPKVGDQTGTHTLLVTTMGDMNVPATSGVSLGRAAGLIDYQTPLARYADDPRFAGLTANELLIQSQSVEAIDLISDFQDATGALVHLDLENFSGSPQQSDDPMSGDVWALRGVPRLDPPLRLGLERADPLGGVSAALFPFVKPGGYHGFSFPGQEQDIRFQRCLDRREEQLERCAGAGWSDEVCDEIRALCREEAEESFDLGNFMAAFLGDYVRSGGLSVKLEPCISWGGCNDIPPPPPARETPVRLEQGR